MKYRAVTISREFGSGGAATAEALAGSLGWRLLDSALLREIANRAGVPESSARALDEHVDPWLYRVMRPVLGTSADGVSMAVPVDVFDADSAAKVANAVIREAHRLGNCVIVGRGAQCILRGLPDVLRVFIYASTVERAQRIQCVPGRIPAGTDVVSYIHEMDRRRIEYIRLHFGENGMDPHLYDLMINSHGDPQMAARVIVAAMREDRQTAA
jgi:cytidylate kinase